MGFFQDLKQDLSQTVNDAALEDAELDITAEDEDTVEDNLFAQSEAEDFKDLEAMLEKEVAALGNGVVEPTVQEDGAKEELEEISMAEEAIEYTEQNEEVEQILNEVEQNVEEEIYMEQDNQEKAEVFPSVSEISTDTAVITEGMTITGDISSSGNMDLIGIINGNIDILGKLNITGSVNGNSSAAEIYAESAQINGEVKSKGSVKIGQSSVVIGNIFATSAVIAGAVKGDIDVHGPVILDTSAIVMGNIKSKSVQINNGAVIEGMCSQCYADVSPTSFFSDVKKNRK